MNGYSIESKMQRMKEDLAMVKNQDEWPGPLLHLKTQPWHNEPGKWGSFAHIHFLDPLNVIQEHGPSIRYASYEAMVEQWSVD